ncbi:glycosyltransferase family 1 protein [Polynucleobacter sp. Adler-ghost]|uniref:glycosyltransferase family 4 protein n=1 Tax=Polynucleobacter sp. Adler-ghost TaxID=2770234 RepID=UPI001BFDC3BE|nr:glycosyltransferase family 1 protein [Polynucleobacter sp. Adler-ghost]QWE31065.1 glycosyltransferase family 4 protein [Polynucleobacter sp. Adler-ghost]
MKLIAIDGRLIDFKMRGMGVFIFNVVINLSCSIKDNEKLIIFTNKKSTSVLLNSKINNKNVRIVFFNINELIYEQIILPIAVVLHCPDYFLHSGNTCSLIFPPIKRGMLIHDVSYLSPDINLKANNVYRALGRLYRKLTVTIASKFVDHIFTVSHFAKNDIISRLNCGLKDKIKVVYNGVDLSKFTPELSTKKENQVLFVSGSDRQKNLKKFLKRVINFEKRLNDLKFIVIGVSSASELGLTEVESISYMGHLTGEELINMYKSSKYFVIPSLYESFGIPGIEALAAGCILYASKGGALPEIYQDHASFFSGSSDEEIDNVILDILNGPSEVDIKKNLMYVAKYNWSAVADAVLQEMRKSIIDN